MAGRWDGPSFRRDELQRTAQPSCSLVVSTTSNVPARAAPFLFDAHLIVSHVLFGIFLGVRESFGKTQSCRFGSSVVRERDSSAWFFDI